MDLDRPIDNDPEDVYRGEPSRCKECGAGPFEDHTDSCSLNESED